jgi:hypothetical protein
MSENRSTETQAAAEAPATKAPAKMGAEMPAVVKLRWKLTGERTPKGEEATATNIDCHHEITGSKDSWTAVVRVGRKTTVLREDGKEPGLVQLLSPPREQLTDQCQTPPHRRGLLARLLTQ